MISNKLNNKTKFKHRFILYDGVGSTNKINFNPDPTIYEVHIWSDIKYGEIDSTIQFIKNDFYKKYR